MTLRPYQQDAVNATMSMLRRSISPIVIEAPTGAGKSHIIAALADELTAISNKKLLCIAPSAELVTQNYEKYRASTGRKASFYSASVGEKSLRHSVIFGTPMTIKNSLDKFRMSFVAVVLDEAHRITPTVRDIIARLRQHNPNLRVIGLSATPYRLGDGYIYRQDEKGNAYGEEHARKPYFTHRVYTIEASHLIEKGWLTPPTLVNSEESYDVSQLEKNSFGKYSSESIDRAFVGQGRKTAKIVDQIVKISADRRGVLIFAATVAHAREVLESLPSELSAIVTGKTKKSERKKILKQFKSMKIKYLVNVSVLTTGFDAPHVDVVAMLRPTESVSLMQQMIGRGLRIAEGKSDCIVLDYAENVKKHCPDGNLFDPEIKADRLSGGIKMEVKCEDCESINGFSIRADARNVDHDENGYAIDLTGKRIIGEHGPEPVHYGRRCNGLVRTSSGEWIRCSYRWTHKKCKACKSENDIAARFCVECGEELVNPNKKLKLLNEKPDPTQPKCEEVLSWQVTPTISMAGNEMKKINVVTAHRSFTALFTNDTGYRVAQQKYDQMKLMTKGWLKTPETVTYKMNKKGFFDILKINEGINETA